MTQCTHPAAVGHSVLACVCLRGRAGRGRRLAVTACAKGRARRTSRRACRPGSPHAAAARSAAAHARGGDDQQPVTGLQDGGGHGDEAAAAADDQGQVRLGRQPEFGDLHPVQPGPGGICAWSRSAGMASSGAASTIDLHGFRRCDHLQPPGHPRQRRALQQREHADDDEHQVEQPGWRRARRALIGIVASTIGTAPRSPAQDRKACCARAPAAAAWRRPPRQAGPRTPARARRPWRAAPPRAAGPGRRAARA